MISIRRAALFFSFLLVAAFIVACGDNSGVENLGEWNDASHEDKLQWAEWWLREYEVDDFEPDVVVSLMDLKVAQAALNGVTRRTIPMKDFGRILRDELPANRAYRDLKIDPVFYWWKPRYQEVLSSLRKEAGCSVSFQAPCGPRLKELGTLTVTLSDEDALLLTWRVPEGMERDADPVSENPLKSVTYFDGDLDGELDTLKLSRLSGGGEEDEDLQYLGPTEHKVWAIGWAQSMGSAANWLLNREIFPVPLHMLPPEVRENLRRLVPK